MINLEPVIKKVYQLNGYTLDQEVLNVLLDTSQHKLISAPAGGTKTSLTQLIVTLEKLRVLITGERHNAKVSTPQERIASTIPKTQILCLVYNRHNVGDIEDIHAKMFNTLVSLKIFSHDTRVRNYSEPGVTASTMHGFADKAIKDNLGLLKMRAFNLSDESLIQTVFKKSVETVLNKNNSSLVATNQFVADCKQLYELYVGLLLYKTPEDQPLTDSIQFELVLQGMDIPSKYLRQIFMQYEKNKKLARINEYSDMLRLADTLLDIPVVREHFQNYYQIIVADEVQDFTPLMFSIYKRLVGPNTKTITVGDSNQSIYSFLGAETDTLSRFEDIMGYAPKRFNLSVNRRCREKTMPFALNTLALNGVDKSSIRTTKKDGVISMKFFNNTPEHVKLIRDEIAARAADRVNPSSSMGILFRTKDESIMLSRNLYESRILTNYINARNFSEHTLYTMFINLLRELFIHKTQKGLSMLHWITPFTKDNVREFFDFDEKSGVSKTCPNAFSWHRLDFRPIYGHRNFFTTDDQVNFIKDVAADSSNKIASDVIPRLAEMFFNNFYAHLPLAKDDEYVHDVLSWLIEDLSSGYSLEKAIIDLETNVNRYISRGRKVGKYNISTIHGTKGLEFDAVIVNLMGNKTVVKKELSPQAAMFQQQEENRLFYVASTRQKNHLLLLASTEFPHRLANPEYIENEEEKELPKPTFDNLLQGELEGGVVLGSSRSNRRRRSLLEE